MTNKDLTEAQRPKFEMWAKSQREAESDETKRDDIGHYKYSDVAYGWKAWQAAYARGAADGTEKLELVIERDRTRVCDGVNALLKILREREWLGESRGPYEWDDDRWHEEFRATSAEIKAAVTDMQRIAADLSNSPKSWDKVQQVREAIRARQERGKEKP